MPRHWRNSYVTRVTLLVLCYAVSLLSPLVAGNPMDTVAMSDNTAPYIDEFTVPTQNGAPLAITVDNKGAVWFTESNVSRIGRFDPSTRSFTEYEIQGVGDMWGIVVDQNQLVWFTEYAGAGDVNPAGSIVSGGHGRLGQLDPISGNVTFVDIPTVGSFPFRLIVDLENKIWFTELLGNRTGVYDQRSGELTEYEVSKTLSGPADLVFDDEGALWFTESFDRKIVRLDPHTKALTEFSLGSLVFSPVGISIDREGDVWVADHGGNWIAELDPQSMILSRYPTHKVLGDLTIPNGLLIDADGRVWFCEHVGNAVGYFDAQTRTMVEFSIPTGPISTALWLALAPNGNIWFTEWSGNKLGVVHADRSVPVSLEPSKKSLQLEPGTETSVAMTVKLTQEVAGNGSFEYSWGTYSISDVSASFSPQNPSWSGLSETKVEAKLTVSENTKPGDYTLGLGLDLGTVRVWTLLEVEVTSPKPPLQLYLTILAVPILVLAGAGGLLAIKRARKRSSH